MERSGCGNEDPAVTAMDHLFKKMAEDDHGRTAAAAPAGLNLGKFLSVVDLRPAIEVTGTQINTPGLF